METVTANHEEKESIVVDVTLPGHDERVMTALFSRTRDELIKREDNRSFVTGRTEEEIGQPLEAHHFALERCLQNAVDWPEFCKYAKRMAAQWARVDEFCDANPDLQDLTTFTDDMTVNGMLIEKPLHTGQGTGIHFMPYPLWQLWCYGKEGFQFTKGVSVFHEDEAQPFKVGEQSIDNPLCNPN